MKDRFNLRISPKGDVEAVYQDGLAEVLDAETKEVRRASNVEFEEMEDGARGWTVRAAHDKDLAIRWKITQDGMSEVEPVVSKTGAICLFDSRERALEWEVLFFWELAYRDLSNDTGLEVVYLTQQELNGLQEYSCSIPTGTVIGKRWKRREPYHANNSDAHWYMGEYIEDKDPEKVGIMWRRIAIVERKETR